MKKFGKARVYSCLNLVEKMSLTLWKEVDEFFDDTCRSHRYSLLPTCWRRHHQWRNDCCYGLCPRELITCFPKEFKELERKAREFENRLAFEIVDLAPSQGSDGFQVRLDIANFGPNEITVTTNDDWVTIEGKHEERQGGNGHLARYFKRRYAMPPGHDSNKVTSDLSSNGILTVKAPLSKAIKEKKHVTIQSTTTRLKVK